MIDAAITQLSPTNAHAGNSRKLRLPLRACAHRRGWVSSSLPSWRERPSLPTGEAMVGLAPSYPPPTLVVADERRRDPVSSKYTLRVGFANLQKRIYGTAGSVGLTPPSNQQALLSRIRAAVGYKISLGCARVRDPPQRNVINVTLMFATPWALAWATLSPPGIGNSHVCL
eukprot:GHVU01005955.1.p1 GENE.GHVU01005955.1~~GHVU01005955.1.p1  ORF type:complete len:171 (+),score=3.87 GHVU01005955.1:463-975(+)